MFKQWILPAVFLIGLVMTLYPWVSRSIAEHQQNKLLTQWEIAWEVEPVDIDYGEGQGEHGGRLSTAENVQEVSDIQAQVAFEDVAADEESEAETHRAVRNKSAQELKGRRVFGTIAIPTIEAYEPILEDSSAKSLKIGVGNVVAGRNAGDIGNLVLAGHRSWTYGKQFSRLNELDRDDEIELQTQDGNFTYVVTDMFLVEPDGVEVLEQSEDRSLLTLITCHPMKNPTHRLIVQAELK